MSKKQKIWLGIGGVLIFVFFILPFLIPIPPIEGATNDPKSLAYPDSQFVDINGLQVHFKTNGSGEPVFLLLHGFGANLTTWNQVWEPLSAYGRVIAFDRPAFGLTERPLDWEGQNPYSPAAQLELINGLLDFLEEDRVILVGNSAGGTVSVNYALAYPERVEALILVDPAIYSGGGAPPFIKPLLALPQFKRLGPLVARSFFGSDSGTDALALAWNDVSKVTPEMIEGYTRPTRIENWDKALWEFTLASEDPDLVPRLGELTMPTLVVTGDNDRIVPTEQSVRLAGELPNARLVIIPNSGHVPHEETPLEFMQAVADFLPTLP